MKNCIFAILFSLTLFSCGTKYNYIDTGKAIPFDGDMYAYLQSSPYNWDSVRLMIDRANLRDAFQHDEITFLGLTNHTIRMWLIKNGTGHDTYGYKCVNDIPVEMCRAIVLSHVIDTKMMRDDIERIETDEKGNHVGGGRKVKTRFGNYVWLWTKQSKYMGVQGMGPVYLFVTPLKDDMQTEISESQVASTNIEPDNGVVQALEYSYKIENIGQLIVE